MPAPKERDVRNRYENPFPLGNFRAMTEDLPVMSGTDEAPNWQPARVPALTWKELDWLRSLTTLPLVLKGIRTAEDAHLAMECGCQWRAGVDAWRAANGRHPERH